jgi:hypothetical protein
MRSAPLLVTAVSVSSNLGIWRFEECRDKHVYMYILGHILWYWSAINYFEVCFKRMLIWCWLIVDLMLIDCWMFNVDWLIVDWFNVDWKWNSDPWIKSSSWLNLALFNFWKFGKLPTDLKELFVRWGCGNWMSLNVLVYLRMYHTIQFGLILEGLRILIYLQEVFFSTEVLFYRSIVLQKYCSTEVLFYRSIVLQKFDL